MPKITTISPLPKFRDTALLAQAAPVQNTWYTILDTTINARIIGLIVAVADTGETLQTRMIIDGVTVGSISLAANAGTDYQAYLSILSYAAMQMNFTATDNLSRSFLIEGRSVKIEVRKTTAAGTGILYGAVVYSKW